MNKLFYYFNAESLCIYQFCEQVWRQTATIIQLCPNFFANRATYGVKESQKFLIRTNK